MNDDLISRARAIEVVKAMVHAPDVGNDAATFGCMVWGVLVRLPAVDSGPVRHGRWDDDLKCTVCGIQCIAYKLPDDKGTIYIKTPCCPNCGAKMDGGSE